MSQGEMTRKVRFCILFFWTRMNSSRKTSQMPIRIGVVNLMKLGVDDACPLMNHRDIIGQRLGSETD